MPLRLTLTATLRWASWLALAIATTSWLVARWRHRLDLPPPWPDEALFMQPGLQALRGLGWGTPLADGALPAIAQHTHWVPPFYPLVLTPLTWLADGDLVTLRWTSALIGVVVGVLAWRLGRRLGLPVIACNMAIAAVAVDPLWLRATSVLRMDLLALALALASLSALADTVEGHQNLHGWRLSGLWAVLAAATHPLGGAAVLAVALSVLAPHPLPRFSRLRAAMVAGGPIALLWWAWILWDWPAWQGQWQLQLARKAGRVGELWPHLRAGADAYGAAADVVLRAWCLATLGWALHGWRARHTVPWGLPLWHGLMLGLLLWSHEMWYPPLLAPTTALGLGLLVQQVVQLGEAVNRPAPRQRVVMGIAAVWLLVQSLRWPISGLRERNVRSRDAATRPAEFDDLVQRLAIHLPQRATVYVAAIADPTTVLWRIRPDLTLRHFSPVPLPHGVERARREACGWAIYGGVPEAPRTAADGLVIAEVALPPSLHHLSPTWQVVQLTPSATHPPPALDRR